MKNVFQVSQQGTRCLGCGVLVVLTIDAAESIDCPDEERVKFGSPDKSLLLHRCDGVLVVHLASSALPLPAPWTLPKSTSFIEAAPSKPSEGFGKLLDLVVIDRITVFLPKNNLIVNI